MGLYERGFEEKRGTRRGHFGAKRFGKEEVIVFVEEIGSKFEDR